MDIEEYKRIVRSGYEIINFPKECYTEEDINEFALRVKRCCGEPILPNPGESLAIAFRLPKTAALAFDRIYRMPMDNLHIPEERRIPKKIGFYGATQKEIWFQTVRGMSEIASVVGIGNPLKGGCSSQEKRMNEVANLGHLANSCAEVFHATPTIFYQTPSNCAADFPNGKQIVLTVAISNLAMVCEEDLSWEQVVEFRKDEKARLKYKRFARWVDAELISKSASEVIDLIAVRLDDYDWAIKKHGLKTLMGSLSCLLDPKFVCSSSVAVAATAYTHGELWAALATVALTVGRASLSFGSSVVDGIDERRKENYEVAYIHDIKKQLASSASYPETGK